MRNALRRHFDARSVTIHTVTATHHHEEHTGNLEWMASATGADLLLTRKTSARLGKLRVPLMRRMVIGQPPPVTTARVEPLGERVVTASGLLEVIPTPGHSDDHVCFCDPRFKLLFAGDSFMGGYFSSPNPDVDSLAWIATLERLIELGVEILVEGHGHIHTLSREIPDIPDIVIRHAPEAELKARLDFFHWVRRQIETGQQEDAAERDCRNLFSLGSALELGTVRSRPGRTGAERGRVFAVGTGEELPSTAHRRGHAGGLRDRDARSRTPLTSIDHRWEVFECKSKSLYRKPHE
jgi:glyoxylase-like metal-dependent hydrolase (beta-lactamase superfamily II)